jgi:hypothetical protein
MGLYDRYQLSQSQLVKQPAGSAISDYVKVASTLQDRYDTAINISDELDRQLQNAPVRPEDKPAFDQMKAKYKSGIQDIAARGDYENMLRPVSSLAKNFAGEYNHFAENMKREQAYGQQLQDYFEKGIIKDASNINRYITASKNISGGMKLDPTTGQYTSKFQGLNPAKELDYNEISNKLLDHMKADTTFQHSIGIYDDNYIKSITRIEELPKEKIEAAFKAYAAIDPEYRGYVRGMQQLAIAELPADAINKLTPESREDVIKRAAIAGKDPEQYMKESVARNTENTIYGNLVNLGLKGAYREDKSDFDFGPETAAAKRRKEDEGGIGTIPGFLGQAQAIGSTLLRDGEVKASGWDRFMSSSGLGALTGRLFSGEVLFEDVEGGARQQATTERVQREGKVKGWSNDKINEEVKKSIASQDKTLTLSNGVTVREDQYNVLKPLAVEYARKAGKKTTDAESWNKAQVDVQNRAGYNIGVENITNSKQLDNFEKITRSSAMFETVPVYIRTEDGWKKYSGLNSALKGKVKNLTAADLKNRLTIAGTVQAGNPLTPGGLALSVPIDDKDASKGSYDIIAEIDPRVYQGEEQGVKSILHQRAVQQYYDLKNSGTLHSGVTWEYNDADHSIVVKKGNEIISKEPAPQITQ